MGPALKGLLLQKQPIKNSWCLEDKDQQGN